jgi:hypothetical protein
MPESVTDRCTKSHEYIFLLSKSRQYYFDNEAIKEPVRNRTSNSRQHGEGYQGNYPNVEVTDSATSENSGVLMKHATSVMCGLCQSNHSKAHTSPPSHHNSSNRASSQDALKSNCGTVLDPFFGAGTTGLVAQQHGRNWIGCELNPVYAEMASKRIKDAEPQPKLFT